MIDSYLELAVAMLIVAPLNLKPAVVPELSLPKTAGASYEDDNGIALTLPQRVPLELQIVEDQQEHRNHQHATNYQCPMNLPFFLNYAARVITTVAVIGLC